MMKVTCLVVGLSAAMLVSGCSSKRHAAAAPSPQMQSSSTMSSSHAMSNSSAPIAVPDSTIEFIRKASFKTVFVNQHGQVVHFVPDQLVAAPGATLPPENAPLKHIKVNAKGEVMDWQLADVPGNFR